MEKQIDAKPGARAARKAATALLFFGLVGGGIMLAGPDQAYPWIKALHVVAIISWMAGMLFLPRLFASAARAKSSELFMAASLLVVLLSTMALVSSMVWKSFGAASRGEVRQYAAQVATLVKNFCDCDHSGKTINIGEILIQLKYLVNVF